MLSIPCVHRSRISRSPFSSPSSVDSASLSFPLDLDFPPPHGATYEYFGVFTHVRGVEGSTCKVGDPITEIVVTLRDEAIIILLELSGL